MEEACTICEKWHDHVYWDHQPRRVKFCKILDEDFSWHLRLPKKFMSHFGGKLSETIDLKGPGGNTWYVRLAKIGCNAFLENGWKEFSEAHQLKENDILFFEYEGNSCFNVLMFDSTECERVSSYFVKKRCSVKQEMAPEVLQEILETGAPSRSKMHKRQKSRCNEQNVCFPKPDKPETSETNELENRGKKQPLLSRKHVPDAGEEKALQLALGFQPQGPSFLLRISKYNANRTDFLAIPCTFGKKYLARETEIILRLPQGKEMWTINYRNYSKRSFYFVTGWRSFFIDNALEEGDVCVFEQSSNQQHITMVVHIFRIKSGS